MTKKVTLIIYPYEAFGFKDYRDFFSTLTWYESPRLLVVNSLIIICGYLSTFITKYIWSDKRQLGVILFLVAVDVFLGSHIAWKNGKFETRKFLRSLWVLIYYIIALAVVHNFSNLNPEFKIFGPLVFYWLAGKTFLSVVKNLALLGVPMPPKLKALVLDKIDAFKVDDGEDKEQPNNTNQSK